MPAIVEEYVRENAGFGTVIDVNNVDDELTITLNGQLLGQLIGPAGEQDQLNRNITRTLREGMNTLVFSLVNLSATGNNPASMNASVSIGGERINLNQSSISGAGATQPTPTGLFYQATFLLKK